ncbi:hypothetical protein [Mediterraneibacter agrestimuris]|uniref:hypothetical protein n=1 Tax=Mediterraneibacter agrestimuris TaxID=2941333 RepID=UPI0020415A57|nr:hypothetical protein [Mediterraneibacter agrestimuris]
MSNEKKQLDYFSIDGVIGGNQEWFRNLVMYMGGCAAATACDCCIYFALRRGLQNLYPFDIENLNKEDYIQFGMKMKPYIKPRVGGVKKLSMFIEGFGAYLEDTAEEAGENISEYRMEGFSGKHTAEEAAEAIKEQIDAGFPVPYLMLRHKNPKYKDFVWHWFLCYGYEKKDEDFLITVATYGESTTFSLKDLWNTGYEERGGLILYRNRE